MRPAIGPAPGGGPLVLAIECTVSPADQFGVPHTVSVWPDWSVAVPHDLEAERVAALFGGWSSCERFASAAVPAYRRMVEVMSGASELDRTPGGSWATSRAPGCCTSPSVFASHFQALLHEASPSHLAAAFGTTAQAVRVIAAAGRRAWSQAADPSLLEGGEAGYRELWDRGIHPERVVRLAHALPDAVSPLAVATLVEAERRDIDTVWLAGVAAVFPIAEFAAWCVSNTDESGRITAAEVRELRDLGLSPRDAMAALEGGVAASAIADAVHVSGARPSSLARWMGAWARIGCTPTGEHYLMLAERRLLHARPFTADIDALVAGTDGTMDRTEAAVMLAIEPSPHRVLAAIRGGVRSAAELRPTR